MKILCKTYYGVFFNTSLIDSQNKDEILSILSKVNVDEMVDFLGETLLHVAAKYGKVWLARHLIDLGANADAQNHLRETPLMLAVKNYEKKMVTVLLEANADIFVPDHIGECALKKAFDIEKRINHDHRFNISDQMLVGRIIAEALLRRVTIETLSKSSHVDSQVFHVNCPLYCFMRLKNIDVIRLLLEKASPVDAKDPETGISSLHMAVKDMNLEIVKLLLEHGADVNVEDVNGDTPITYLPSSRLEVLEMCETLFAAGANSIDHRRRKILVESLLFNGKKEIVRCVLKYPLDLYFNNRYGYTSLHELASNSNPGIFAEFSDFYSDLDVRAVDSKRTLLHCAALRGNVSTVRFLLDRGADVNAICAYGYTPLSLLCTQPYILPSDQDASIECIEFLLARGANPRIITNKTLHFHFRIKLSKFMPPVLVHLAAVEASGQDIGRMREVLSDPSYRNIFGSKKKELEEMKQIELDKSVTLLDFLVATNDMISVYARYKRAIAISFSSLKIDNFDPHYQSKLRERFLKLTELVELRRNAAAAVDKIFIDDYNISVVDVAEKIIEYLEDQELARH